MDNSIRAGDLVCVVGSLCRHDECDIGGIVKVSSVQLLETGCDLCESRNPLMLIAELDYGDGTDAWKPLSILKKIPPLVEPESIVERDTVKA